MTSSRRWYILSAILIVFIFTFSSCDTQPSVGISDSLDVVADLELIEGAENSTVTVNKGTSSYFSLNVSNIAENAHVQEGTNQKGWCVLWDKPIDSNNSRHDGLALYSTFGDEKWKPVNYLLTIKPQLELQDPDLTYLEIQAAIWTLRDYPKFNVDMSVEQMPSRLVRDGKPNFDKAKVKEIVAHVNSNYESFQYNGASTYAVIAETPSDTQTIIIEVDQTVWAYGQYSFRSQEYKNAVGATGQGNGRWGWVFELDSDVATTELIAGGGDDDGSKEADEVGTIIGSLDMSKSANTLDITYSPFNDYLISDLHLWVGCSLGEFPTSGNNGNPSLNNFQYTYSGDPEDSKTFSIDLGEIGCSGTVLISAHAGELYKVEEIEDDEPDETFFMADNGVTIMCPTAEVGEKGFIDGVEYESVDNDLLRTRRDQGADLAHVCTTPVTDMSNLFASSSFSSYETFNQDIGGWDTGNVTNMSGMFSYASSFNIDIGDWDTGNVTDFSTMFFYASSFDQDLEDWDTGKVSSMRGMFYEATSFNGKIDSWMTGKVNDMVAMFLLAESFNGKINEWNTSNVTNMSTMFLGALSFNQDISGWETGNVTKMDSMFDEAVSFNQDIGGWDTGKVTDMSGMFNTASSFNQDIGNWDTKNVNNMGAMFARANKFNQDLSKWCVEQIVETPPNFDTGATSWVKPRPIWGTCPDISAPLFTMTDLTQYGLNRAVDINDHGDIVGGSLYWNNSTNQIIQMGIGGAIAMNNVGGVINTTKYWDAEIGAIEIVEEENSYCYAYDINDDGTVVGEINYFIFDEDGEVDDIDWYGMIWNKDTRQVINNNRLYLGESYAINNNGNSTGRSLSAPHEIYVYSPNYTEIGPFDGYGYGKTNAINIHNQVVGKFTEAFIWDEENGITDLGTLGGGDSEALDINDHSQVVGYSSIGNGEHRAFFWDEQNGMVELPTLDGGNSTASGINNEGQIVGTSDGIPVMWELTLESGNMFSSQ